MIHFPVVIKKHLQRLGEKNCKLASVSQAAHQEKTNVDALMQSHHLNGGDKDRSPLRKTKKQHNNNVGQALEQTDLYLSGVKDHPRLTSNRLAVAGFECVHDQNQLTT